MGVWCLLRDSSRQVSAAGRHQDKKLVLSAGSLERGVLGVGSIPVAKLPPCQDMRIIAL